jgi:hypothetical protein
MGGEEKEFDTLDTDVWLQALERADLTEKEIRLLRIHHTMPESTATAEELANAMGWDSFRATSINYGRLAKKILNQLGREVTDNAPNVDALVRVAGYGSEGHLQLQMRANFADAVVRYLATQS